MPSYKGHLVGGAIAFLAIVIPCKLYNYSFIVLSEWFLWCLAGSLFPDIDTKSKGQKLFYSLLLPLFIVFFLQHNYHNAFICSILLGIPPLVKHRGIFHSYPFIFIIALLFLFFLSSFFIINTIFLLDILFFIIGALSHIFLDRCLTKINRKRR